MNCPSCQTPNQPGQKFCGTCGQKLEAACVRCAAVNPPQYKFCGQCGELITSEGAIVLAPSGLIVRADQKVLNLLGYREKDMQAKPFSLFVVREDLVIFFSHMNELNSSRGKQAFELTLKRADGKGVCLLLECSVDADPTQNADEVRILVSETADDRQAAAQLQRQQDMLGLIYTVADNISTVSNRHLDIALKDALKKVCLVSKADHGFIFSIKRQSKSLEPVAHWHQATKSSSTPDVKIRSVPVAVIKNFMVSLRRYQALVIDDAADMTSSERYELLAWLHANVGSLMCYLIYSAKRPIGVIGLANNHADRPWEPDCVALVKFLGQFLADRLSIYAFGDQQGRPAGPPKGPPATPEARSKSAASDNVIDISARQSRAQGSTEAPPDAGPSGPSAVPRKLPDMARPMRLEKPSGPLSKDQQTVFPRDDGLILLTCPSCGLQESVSMSQFNRLGGAIQVHCSCRKEFAALLEKRRSYRKTVQLDGYFSIAGDLGPVDANDGIWGPMTVKNLSKTGLRFSSPKADLVRAGELLMVRFNLDNSNQALIHKPARVISVAGNEVGCKFEGSDSYDVTLGFYFI